MVALIIIGIIVVIVIVAVKQYNATKDAFEAGQIIQRKTVFWEEKEIFTMSASVDRVFQKVISCDYSQMAATAEKSGGQSILIKSGHAWNAEFRYAGEKEQKYLYTLNFTTWKTQRYGTPYNINSMNMLYTTVEKAMLQLDANTKVETRKLETHTKSKFF